MRIFANLFLLVGWFYADPTILHRASRLDWGGISLMVGLGLLIAVREKNRKAKAIQIWNCYCSRCGAEGRSDLSGLCLDCERIFIEKIVSAMAENKVTKVQL